MARPRITTPAQTSPRRPCLALTACTLLGLLAMCGCASSRSDRLTAPRTLTVPYDISRGDVFWVVAPLRNDAGTSQVDTVAMSDVLVGTIEEVKGLRVMPIVRVMTAMQALEMSSVRTPSDARRLAQALGADGIVVGAITSWDPYTPSIGVTLALYARPNTMGSPESTIDVRSLQGATSAAQTESQAWIDRPLAIYAERLDAKNNAVLMDVRSYASGRTVEPSALGWRRYLQSIELYSQFVMHSAVDGILQQEWVRVSRAQMPDLSERPEARTRP
jgi:hypothetical protein